MIILGIDSSMKISSAAVIEYNNEKINILARSDSAGIAETSSRGGHSENLLPMVDSALNSCGLRLDMVDRFAVTVGPGSFTGIRIGVATLKGLAFNRGSCCAGVSALDALCLSIPDAPQRYIAAPLIDARRNQAYNALYLYENGFHKKITKLTSDRIILIPDLINELNSDEFASLPVYFCGDVKPEDVQGEAERFTFVQHGNIAEAACRIAAGTTSIHEELINPGELAPRYLIKTQAEREYIAKQERDGSGI